MLHFLSTPLALATALWRKDYCMHSSRWRCFFSKKSLNASVLSIQPKISKQFCFSVPLNSCDHALDCAGCRLYRYPQPHLYLCFSLQLKSQEYAWWLLFFFWLLISLSSFLDLSSLTQFIRNLIPSTMVSALLYSYATLDAARSTLRMVKNDSNRTLKRIKLVHSVTTCSKRK